MPKYSTKEIYNLAPSVLSVLKYKDALTLCKINAIKIRSSLVREVEKISEWQVEKEEKIKYLSKSVVWCEYKIDEMGEKEKGRIGLFFELIKTAFKVLVGLA